MLGKKRDAECPSSRSVIGWRVGFPVMVVTLRHLRKEACPWSLIERLGMGAARGLGTFTR